MFICLFLLKLLEQELTYKFNAKCFTAVRPGWRSRALHKTFYWLTTFVVAVFCSLKFWSFINCVLLTKLVSLKYKKATFPNSFFQSHFYYYPESQVYKVKYPSVTEKYINEVSPFYVMCWHLQIYTFDHCNWRNKNSTYRSSVCFWNKWWVKEILIIYKNIIISLSS